MFSADIFFAKHDFPPKNGPVPIQAVSAYQGTVPIFAAEKTLQEN